MRKAVVVLEAENDHVLEEMIDDIKTIMCLSGGCTEKPEGDVAAAFTIIANGKSETIYITRDS